MKRAYLLLSLITATKRSRLSVPAAEGEEVVLLVVMTLMVSRGTRRVLWQDARWTW